MTGDEKMALAHPFAASAKSLGWFNGDFNLDGKINIDDYGGNIESQRELL